MAYDDVVLGTNGGPSLRWKFNSALTEEITGLGNQVAIGIAYTPTIIPHDTGNCLQCDGATTEFRPLDSPLINTTVVIKRDILVWFKLNSVTGKHPLWSQGGGTNGLILYVDNGVLYGAINETSVLVSSIAHPTPVVADQLYVALFHMDAALSAGGLNIGLNGVFATGVADGVGVSLATHTGDPRIAYSIGTYYADGTVTAEWCDGDIADVSYWSEPTRLMTEEEFNLIYSAGAGVNVTGSVAFDSEGVVGYDPTGASGAAGVVGYEEEAIAAYDVGGGSGVKGSVADELIADIAYDPTGTYVRNVGGEISIGSEETVGFDVAGDYISNVVGSVGYASEIVYAFDLYIPSTINPALVPWVSGSKGIGSPGVGSAKTTGTPDVDVSIENKPKVTTIKDATALVPGIKDATHPY